MTKSGAEPGKICHFPFIWKGRTYEECTKTDWDQLWCSTEVDNNGEFIKDKWGNCDCIGKC